GSAETVAARRVRDGLWVMGRPIGPGSVAWLFDDLPFARVDEAALEALSVTLRALLRRPVADPLAAEARPQRRGPPSSGDPLRDTLMAVARANGRVSVAARALGVHRNTVLYRLRRARAEQGIDPRRPEDALRLLREADRD
ncbi:MAG: helix-turn-helix domain-containing protein, partial [Candidatus Limnocylindria bacterium]